MNTLPGLLTICAAALAACADPPERRSATSVHLGSAAAGVAAPCDPAQPCQKIVFTKTNPASPIRSAEIYVMNPDGTDALRLTTDDFGDALPSLSPDGKGKIVFDSNRLAGAGTSNSDLFLMNVDGTADGEFPMPLTKGSSATWSPDGKNVAFHRSAGVSASGPDYGIRIPGRNEPGGPTTDSDIFVLNVDDSSANGEGPTNITNGLCAPAPCVAPTSADVRGPLASDDADWSPGGQWIAFTSRNPSNNLSAELYIMNVATRAVIQLTSTIGEEERSPDWSPDGTQIAFGRRVPPAAFELWVLDLDPETHAAVDEHQLTTNAYFDQGASWSPSGDQIVFQSNRPVVDGSTQLLGNQVWVMNADGTDQRRLTPPPDIQCNVSPPLVACPETNFFPSWGQVEVGQDPAPQ